MTGTQRDQRKANAGLHVAHLRERPFDGHRVGFNEQTVMQRNEAVIDRDGIQEGPSTVR